MAAGHRFRLPLSFGYEGVVKILLEREEVNPDKPDSDGRTPLSFAAEDGHEGVVKILLGRGEVNPDGPDNEGRRPLSFAAKYGREGVVKILLGREEVNPDKPDHDGRTPLSIAIRSLISPWSFNNKNGIGRVIALLQSRKAVTPSTI